MAKFEFDDSTDAEKIDYIYRRMRAQEKQEIANNVWKWIIRAIIIVSLVQTYFLFSGLMKGGTSWLLGGGQSGGLGSLLWLPQQQESEISKILHNR